MNFTFFALILLFVLILSILASILGWIAAARIRKSDGKLSGFRLAAFSALCLPTLLLLLISVLLSVLAMRFELVLGLAVLLTLLPLSVRCFQFLLRSVRGEKGGPVFAWANNRYLYSGLIFLWMVGGILSLS